MLKHREKLLKRRLHEAVTTYSKEKVVQERRDWSKESETMPNLMWSIYSGGERAIEDYLSVNEQLEYMQAQRDLSPFEKFYSHFISKDKLSLDRNFDERALAHGKTAKFDSDRRLNFPQTNKTRTQVALGKEQAPQPYNRWEMPRI